MDTLLHWQLLCLATIFMEEYQVYAVGHDNRIRTQILAVFILGKSIPPVLQRIASISSYPRNQSVNHIIRISDSLMLGQGETDADLEY
jgi:hypothetical protein